MRSAVCLSVLLVASLPAHGHHGWSEYDSTRPLNLSGTIMKSGYEHPHGHIRLNADNKTWWVVLAPPTRMANRGLPASALKQGARATVTGYPNRSKPEEMRAERISANGKTVELR